MWLSCAAMVSHLRGTVVMVVLGALASVTACSRTSSSDSSQWSFPMKAKADASSWQVKCDRLCDVKAKAASLESLCAATTEAAKQALGVTRCESRRAAGFPQIPAAAVTDAAIVELTPVGKHDRTAFLALKTAAGWQLARPLGVATAIKGGDAQPVDVPGLAPAGVQINVTLADATGKSERLFVCGLTGEGAVHCPVAVEVASNKSAFAQMAASIGEAKSGGEWRVAVELTPRGYVAKRVAGSVPEGLAGEHGWDAVPR